MNGKSRYVGLVACVVFALVGARPPSAQVGTVKSEQKISETAGAFEGDLHSDDFFGESVTSLGDLDGDGFGDLAVGAGYDDDGGDRRGAVWILFLNSGGTVREEQKISDTEGGFDGVLADDDVFGYSVSSLGDLDGDGTGDLAVGAPAYDGGVGPGKVWILFLNSDGTVASEQEISATAGGFGVGLDDDDDFGSSVSSLGDLKGDDIGDLAVGAFLDDDGGPDRGAVWILFLNSDGTVDSKQKISSAAGGFGGVLDYQDAFGCSTSSVGDLNGDQILDLAVGAYGDDDGGDNQGAVWILFLNMDGTVSCEQKISATEGGFEGDLDPTDVFAQAVSSPRDLDLDGVSDLVVSAEGDDDGGDLMGAVWILFLKPDGTVKSEQKISATIGRFEGVLQVDDRFGNAISAMGDVNGDGMGDLAVGAYLDDDGGTNQGAVWILLLKGPKVRRPTVPLQPTVLLYPFIVVL